MEDVKFRMQMKVGDRIYTGIHETLPGALSLLMEKILDEQDEDDLWAIGDNLTKLHEEIKDLEPPEGLFEALRKIRE